ncbi:MAG: 3-hydroxyacyl-ACP dehydratase FabZ family protein [Verrucomicrobiota bacterium]
MDSLQAALHSLPHGQAFRFLDRVLSLDPGHAATAEYTVRGDEPFLAGHFPGEPLFPGVLLIEAGAQLAGVVARSSAGGSKSRLRLTALRAVKIFGTARPGETLHFEARLLGTLGKLIQAQATASIGPRVVLQAELTLSEEA